MEYAWKGFENSAKITSLVNVLRILENASSAYMPLTVAAAATGVAKKEGLIKVQREFYCLSVSSSSSAETALTAFWVRLASCFFHRLLTWSGSRLGKTRSNTSEYQLTA